MSEARRTERDLSFEAFGDYVASEMALDRLMVTADTLLEDAGIDSLGLYELMLIVEELGCEVDEDQIGGWRTFSDVHCSAISQPADHRRGAP